MMIAELRRLQRRTQQTTIYATHDYEEALALGDRILVLHDGQVDQIGAPDEIYLRPATTFVATITGTPPMNLIPCRIRDRRAIAGELAVAVTDAAGEATLGIRPEHARMGAGLPATVGLIQPVGRRKIVEVTVGGIRLKALGDAAFQAERGAPVGITLDPDRVCFYDQAGRLTPARAVGPFMLVGAED
ncbi:MAG: TOBE domain-containing protein [Armatimonadota bacterium]|nr:TOBE domain-containing protein [Armatimonadota bacterium]